jgi:two-component system response regulator YesN
MEDARPKRDQPQRVEARNTVEAAFKYYDRLARVRAFVEANLEEELSLTKVSQIADLSPKYFSAFFRQHTGVRFGDWITGVRIGRARTLLTERNRSVTRVALAVGFKDVRTFQRAFKKVTGMTPRAFKKTVAP